MDKVITTVLLIAISSIMALTLFNMAYPAVVNGGDTIVRMASRAEERMNTRVDIIHGAGELDHTGWWSDANGNLQFEVFLWVKNTGLTTVVAPNTLDVFFGPEGNFTRIPHESQAGGAFPNWVATVEGSGDWLPTRTLRLTVRFAAPLGTGRYFSRVTLPSGASADYSFGM